MEHREYYYLPREDCLQVSAGAGAKVASDGSLLPFYGNTVIFDLDDRGKDALKKLQDALYATCGQVLSEQLTRESFHVTLHDLVNGTDREEVAGEVHETAAAARAAVADVKKFLVSPIPMKPVKLVSMVGTSVVLLLEPVYLAHVQLLDVAYERLQSVVPLSYGLTPHVTLGYYRPGCIAGANFAALEGALRRLSGQLDFTLTLNPSLLRYSEFRDMNHYNESIERK